jgi:uncharacterized flavoprotein (TIGR03862 family)
MSDIQSVQAVVIGGGPAGLMAAEVLSSKGLRVDVYDAMPSFGRKFLQAGVGGLNLTHNESYPQFCRRYADRQPQLQAFLDVFPPHALRNWARELGVETFVGSSGRVFPQEMKAAPLLRAWLRRLRARGVHLHARHRWQGWGEQGALNILAPDGVLQLRPRVTVLALGGASWPHLGSDGAWVAALQARHIQVAPWYAVNCGFEMTWSEYLRQRFAGAPLKAVALTFVDEHGDAETRQGELIISANGIEGSLIYAFSARLQRAIFARGSAVFSLDLAPHRSLERIDAELRKPRGSRSSSHFLRSKLGLDAVKIALLHELLSEEQWRDSALLAHAIKSLSFEVRKACPLEEAISCGGGVRFDQLEAGLMLKALPGTFVAGEMLDWQAPTGGYLLTACFATGYAAGRAASSWLAARPDSANLAL